MKKAAYTKEDAMSAPERPVSERPVSERPVSERWAPERWAIDRRVPLAVILAILMQSAAALLWAGAANERLAGLEARTARIGELVERTARLEEQTKAANAALGRIEERLR